MLPVSFAVEVHLVGGISTRFTCGPYEQLRLAVDVGDHAGISPTIGLGPKLINPRIRAAKVAASRFLTKTSV